MPPLSVSGPIWGRPELFTNDYKILLWMIDAGAFKVPLGRGWIGICADSIGIHRGTITRCLAKMHKMKILHREGCGFYVVKPEALACYVDPKTVENKEAHLYAYRRKSPKK